MLASRPGSEGRRRWWHPGAGAAEAGAQQQPSAGPEDASEFTDVAAAVAGTEVVVAAAVEDGVDAGVAEGERAHVGPDERDCRAELAGLAEGGCGDVHADRVPAAAGE